jgi:hypothetical protein
MAAINYKLLYSVHIEFWTLVGTLQAGMSRVRFPIRSLKVFNLPNLSSRTMALGLTQPVTGVPGIFLGSKARPMCKADNLTDICKPIA